MTSRAEPAQEVPVNLARHRGRLVVTAPLPGCNPSDITVVIAGDRLEIAGDVMGGQKMDYVIREWHPGGYTRTVQLPSSVDGIGATAHYGNGVLVVLSSPRRRRSGTSARAR